MRIMTILLWCCGLVDAITKVLLRRTCLCSDIIFLLEHWTDVTCRRSSSDDKESRVTLEKTINWKQLSHFSTLTQIVWSKTRLNEWILVSALSLWLDGLTLQLLSDGWGYVDFDKLFIGGRMETDNLGTVLSSHPDTLTLARKAVDAAVFRFLTEGKSNLSITKGFVA